MIDRLRAFLAFNEEESRRQLDIVYKFGTADERKAFSRGQINEWNRTRAVVSALVECVEALDKIGKTDHPSIADKTSWIVMTESICLHARKALANLEQKLKENER